MEQYTTKSKIRLGIFVASGFLIFLILIFLIGRQKNLFNPVAILTVDFHNVSGLAVGNNVRFGGINIGTIGDISIVNDSTVRVNMIVKKNTLKFIRTDCKVFIGSEGIIGDRILNISRGTADTISVNDGDKLPSVEPVEIDQIISSLAVTSVNLEMISGQLAEIMIRINKGKGILGRLIQDSVISENLNETIINLRKSSKGLNENMEAAKGNILLRGYFNKKVREQRQDSIEKSRQTRQDSMGKKIQMKKN